MWPNQRLIDLLGIDLPIILSPMSGIGTVELASAVCNAGGLGSIGCAGLAPDVVRRQIDELRARTKRPFSLNFFCHTATQVDAAANSVWLKRLSPYFSEFGIEYDALVPPPDLAPFGDLTCSLVEETRPAVVSFHFGLPGRDLITRIRSAGCRILSSATTVEEAVWLEDHGADIIIAQGAEAGGHRGMFLAANINSAATSQLGTFALVPQIVDAVSVPVVAAGGIADGRGIAAALALGAAGVQMGTAFLLCNETNTSAIYREMLRRSESGATMLTNVFTGRPARAFANRLSREVGPISCIAPSFPGAIAATAQLRAEAQKSGSTAFTPFWAGQASPLTRETPAADLTKELAAEAMDCLRMLSV